MQKIIQDAIEQMVRLGNELNWNSPIDNDYVNAINELRALRDATQQKMHPTLLTEPKNYCNPVNGIHAPFCTGHESQSG